MRELEYEMFFDDRLETVLRQRADSDAGKRTQYRQLLDLLGVRSYHGPDDSRDPSLMAAAWLRMDALGQAIPPAKRAQMIREPGWRFRNPQLAAHLAEFEPEVAAAALSRAQLSEEDWTALIPRLPVRARGFLRLRRDLPVDVEALLDRLGVSDRGLPSPTSLPTETADDAPVPEIAEAPEAVERPEPALPVGVDVARPVEPEPEVPPPPPTPELEGRASNTQPPHDFSDTGLEPPEDEEADEDGAEDGADTPFMLTTPVNDADPVSEAESESQPEKPQDLTLVDNDAIDPQASGRSEISALVERIAQFRRDREGNDGGEGDDSSLMPRLPLGEDQQSGARNILSFGFAADATGRIDWAEGEVAPMVIGTRLVRPVRASSGSERQESDIERAVSRRQPVTAAPLTLDGAPRIAGDWVVDAQPRFSDDGHFTGYVGRFRRPMRADGNAPSAAEQEADRIRQLLHELRTPVTAVQGYAEVIQQQLFGTAPHEYRALAAAIAADAARILAGFEEMDRLARLETGGLSLAPGAADFSAQVERTLGQLANVLAPRLAGIEMTASPAKPLEVAIASEEVETLLWRLLATLAGGCAAGEMLEARLYAQGENAALTCEMPAVLLREEDVFAAEARPLGNAVNAGLFGAGFALRLVRAEAKAVGGDLVRERETLTLTLPQVLTLTQPEDGAQSGDEAAGN